MSKVRRISAFIRAALLADAQACVYYDPRKKTLDIRFYNAIAKDDFCLKNEDLIVWDRRVDKGDIVFFVVRFCADKMTEKPDKIVRGFSFDSVSKKQSRKEVIEQEDVGAQLINGRRHAGSGAIDGYKSDASSDVWQQEAKQTAAQSIGVKLEWLDKITREARVLDKYPMMFIRFTSPEDHIVADDDWVMIPASVFRKVVDVEKNN